MPVLNRRLGFVLVYPATLAATRLFGVGPGIVTALAGGAGMVALLGDRDPLNLGVFLAFSALTVYVTGAWGRAREQAGDSATQRAREEELSAQLRAVVESSEDAVISSSMDGLIQSWNRAAESIFGFTAAEAAGRSMSMLLPPARLDEEKELAERIRCGGHVKQFETERVRKDGKIIQVSLTVSPVYDRSGKIGGCSHIARDISERKAFETQSRQTQKLESLGVLAGGLAHDFNNLLTGIMGNASLVMDEHPEGSKARGRLQEILTASERVAFLIRQMLAFAGKGSFVIEPVDLSAEITEVMPVLRASVSRHVEFNLVLAQNLPPVEADRGQLQQLILNLATNAAEAIGSGKGTVTLATSWRGGEAGPEVILQVADTGCGMTEETRERIFDPFFTTKFTGRGLGLAAVMGIIQAHRGTIAVDSLPGRGSKFTVMLPALAADTGAELADHVNPAAAAE